MSIMDDAYTRLETELKGKIALHRIVTDHAKRLAYGTDASFYRLIPKIILQLRNLEEVSFAIACCRRHSIPCTFRAAGTSLSGQAVSDSVLIMLTDDWRDHQILDDGKKIRLQPGVIGADANKYLMPYQRKIGPDPASINSCKIGGIAANNASGMCCGTAQNSYRTIDSMKIVFEDGTTLDTSDKSSVEAFKTNRPDLIEGMVELHQQIESDPALKEKILHKYRLKNTTGYALNALVDFSDPVDIIEHLMIGSEGTLGFIAEITYNTVVEHPHKATALMVFNDIETASNAVTALSRCPVSAVEMMDGRALQSVADKPGMPAFMSGLSLEHTALLIESRAGDKGTLDQQCRHIMATINDFDVAESVVFTTDAHTVATLWGIRKGMFPAVGAVREAGTTVIIEDVAFPVEKLAGGVRELQALFSRFDYHEAIIFGHALEGNLHFVFTQGFDEESEVERYGNFMDAVAELVAVKYGGSLKAEHGTGRNMAPYVELEWGQQGYRLMQKIKDLFDPQGLFNPGVIINANPRAHLDNLKPMPKADALIDKCIECGFCEAVCPSRTLTLSPRQRIVLYRELKRRERAGEPLDAKQLKEVFEYQGLDTCAATGLCADRCPVGINTGDLVKKLRTEKYQRYTPIARWTANHFTTVTRMTRVGLAGNKFAHKLLGEKALGFFVNSIHKISKGRTPVWYPEYPVPHKHSLVSTPPSTPANSQVKKVVYYPSCASRTMGQQADNPDLRPLIEVTVSLLTKAGYEVIFPEGVSELCCGMPYDSKGMNEIARLKSHQLEDVLWQASEQGTLPILMDTSPCKKISAETFNKDMSIYEPTGFISRYLLKELSIRPLDETVMLHVTCSSKRMGLENEMIALAKACAKKVVLPEHIECCGWAGDKGFTTPELNLAATAPLKAQVPEGCKRGFSNSRTCEIGLSHHSGIPYQSILYLVDDAAS